MEDGYKRLTEQKTAVKWYMDCKILVWQWTESGGFSGGPIRNCVNALSAATRFLYREIKSFSIGKQRVKAPFSKTHKTSQGIKRYLIN